MSWVVPYAVTDVARDHMTEMWRNATTALLGRVNAEGFLGYWPTVIGAEGVDSRDEAFAKWLVDVEKVVLWRLPGSGFSPSAGAGSDAATSRERTR